MVKTPYGLERVVEQVEVQVPVPVIIKESAMGRIALVGDSVISGTLSKSEVPVINIKFIVPFITLHIA